MEENKKKAIELIKKFLPYTKIIRISEATGKDGQLQNAKACAVIVCDEIDVVTNVEYWTEGLREVIESITVNDVI